MILLTTNPTYVSLCVGTALLNLTWQDFVTSTSVRVPHPHGTVCRAAANAPYVCMYVCMHVLACKPITKKCAKVFGMNIQYVCMYVCMYVCIYVCTVCMYVSRYIYIQWYISSATIWKFTQTQNGILVTRKASHLYKTKVFTVRTCMYACIHTYIRTNIIFEGRTNSHPKPGSYIPQPDHSIHATTKQPTNINVHYK